MKKKVLLIIIGIFGLFNSCAIIPFANVAAESHDYGMTVSPMSQKVVLVPGESYSSTIKITNPNYATRNLDFSLSTGSFNQSGSENSIDDYDTVDTSTVTNYNQIMNWIEFEKGSGTVAPNATEIVNFTINVPKNAPAGGQYATILVTDTTDYGGAKGGITIESISQIASIIYAEIAGETIRNGLITENNMPSFLTNSKLEATSMVRNEGNVHTDAEYILQVWPVFSDEEVCTNEEKSETSLILPNTERYHVQSCELPSVGIFRAKQVVKIFGEESVLEKTIIVCPIWLMIVILVVIVAIITAIVVIIKKNKSKKSKD